MAWPSANYVRGSCQVCGNDARMFFCDDHKDPDVRPPKAEWAHVPPAPGGTEGAKAPASPRPDAGAGTPKKERKGLRSFFGRGTTDDPKAPKQTKPKRKPSFLTAGGPRRSGSPLLGDLWTGGGELLSSTPWWVAGRAMAFQAEAAGPILDDAVKGTPIDKVALQPALLLEERFGDAWNLLSLPLHFQMVASQWTKLQSLHQAKADPAILAGRQAQLDFTIRSTKKTIRKSMVPLAKAAARMRKEREDAEAAFSEAFPEFVGVVDGQGNAIPPEDVLFQEMLGPLFAGPPPPPQEASSNGHQPGTTPGEARPEDAVAP